MGVSRALRYKLGRVSQRGNTVVFSSNGRRACGRTGHALVESWVTAVIAIMGMALTGCSQGAASFPPAVGGSGSSPLAALPCSASLMFAAAVAAEHFSTNPAQYPPQPGQGPGAYGPKCDGDWAIALISHPNVGTTDGNELFRAENGKWVDLGGVGGLPADCILEKDGVPASVAKVLWPPAQSEPPSYCLQ